MAIGVNNAGYREILGAAEGMKEDRESWRSFFVWLKERGLKGVRLFIGDKNLGMLERSMRFFQNRAISAVWFIFTVTSFP